MPDTAVPILVFTFMWWFYQEIQSMWLIPKSIFVDNIISINTLIYPMYKLTSQNASFGSMVTGQESFRVASAPGLIGVVVLPRVADRCRYPYLSDLVSVQRGSSELVYWSEYLDVYM